MVWPTQKLVVFGLVFMRKTGFGFGSVFTNPFNIWGRNWLKLESLSVMDYSVIIYRPLKSHFGTRMKIKRTNKTNLYLLITLNSLLWLYAILVNI